CAMDFRCARSAASMLPSRMARAYSISPHTAEAAPPTAPSAWQKTRRPTRDCICLLLHELSKLRAVLLHDFHSRFHLALAALLAALDFLSDLLHELRILLDETEHHIALRLRHVFHLPIRVFLQEKAMDGHGRIIPVVFVDFLASAWYIFYRVRAGER